MPLGAPGAVVLGLVLGLLVPTTHCDFVFPNFFDTTGLVFNGHAFTTSCINNTRYMYGAQQQEVQPPKAPEIRIAESTDVRETVTTETNPPENAEMTFTFFGHREVYDHSPVDQPCDNRIRMTTSEAHQLSSVWCVKTCRTDAGCSVPALDSMPGVVYPFCVRVLKALVWWTGEGE
jgi:hypothetical protein